MKAGFLRILTSAFSVSAILLLVGMPNRALADEVIFESIPSPLPGNVDSEGPEAYGFRELGDGIGFPVNTGGDLTKVTVIMSSWACTSGNWFTPGSCVTNPQSAKFSQPITMNIYQADTSMPAQPKAGALLGTLTQTFQIPYRPSSDIAHCPSGEQWFNTKDNQCYHGLAVPITFNFDHQNISLPSKIVVGIAFNTTDAGPSPLGPQSCSTTTQGCPYDSLNISTYGDVFFNFDGALPLASSVIDPNGIFVNYITAANACNLATTPGVLQDDTVPTNGEPATEKCFTGYHPELEIQAKCAHDSNGHNGNATCPSSLGGNGN
jgi:hypothetical protein